jgi:hypothetical protein
MPTYALWMGWLKSQDGSDADPARQRQSRSPARTGSAERRRKQGGSDRRAERRCKTEPGVTGRGEWKARPTGRSAGAVREEGPGGQPEKEARDGGP